MNRLLLGICLLAVSFVQAGDNPPPTSLKEAIGRSDFTFQFTGNGRGILTAKVYNRTGKTVSLGMPVGLVFKAESGEKQVTLRSADITLPAGAETEAVIPTGGLALGNADEFREVKLLDEPDNLLKPLLALFEGQPDLPRNTAQLAVFAVTEDISLARWLEWLPVAEKDRAISRPTPTEVTQIVDALAFVRLAYPERKPALLADEKLKRLATRNPHSRGKAMSLYGIVLDDVQPGVPSAVPDLKQLLHMTPGDNCPICRQRDDMQKENGP